VLSELFNRLLLHILVDSMNCLSVLKMLTEIVDHDSPFCHCSLAIFYHCPPLLGCRKNPQYVLIVHVRRLSEQFTGPQLWEQFLHRGLVYSGYLKAGSIFLKRISFFKLFAESFEILIEKCSERGTHSPGEEGDGGSKFWKTREIGLPSYSK
jgi:hypothetical protein